MAMETSQLDNPFWSALDTRHREIALRCGPVVRYPQDYAPFVGVRDGAANVDSEFRSLVEPGETVYLLGTAPKVSEAWALEVAQPLVQMVCSRQVDLPDGPEIVELGSVHRQDVINLTALVYPHFFRVRTIELGRYFGIYRDGRLAAMIGERLGTDNHQEISAICTHPDFTGRGYARRLLCMLTNDNIARMRTPFLHVSRRNSRALSLYERNGYAQRRDLDFWSLRRTA